MRILAVQAASWVSLGYFPCDTRKLGAMTFVEEPMRQQRVSYLKTGEPRARLMSMMSLKPWPHCRATQRKTWQKASHW